MDQISMNFMVTAKQAADLAAGNLHIGGLTLVDNAHRVTTWLKGGINIPNGQMIQVTLPNLASAAFAFTQFAYMEARFKEIKEKLVYVIQIQEAQIGAKILTGYNLLIEAERLKDPSQAKIQITQARGLLEEGRNTFATIFEHLIKKGKNDSIRVLDMLPMFILSELTLAKSYTITNDYEIALNKLLRLKSFFLQCNAQIINEFIKKEPLPWWLHTIKYCAAGAIIAVLLPEELGVLGVTLICAGIGAIWGSCDVDHDIKLIEKVAKENIKLSDDIKKLESDIRTKINQCSELPEKMRNMIEFPEVLDSYIEEVNFYKSMPNIAYSKAVLRLPTPDKL